MNTTTVWYHLNCGPQLYIEVPWRVIFVGDFMHMFFSIHNSGKKNRLILLKFRF